MYSITACPVCGKFQANHVLTTSDYTVSGEQFSILQCQHCSFRFTENVPSPNQIGKYYQSEKYISHTNSNQGLFNKIYQLVRNHSLISKRKLVEKYVTIHPGTLLDYGCGTGSFLYEMKSNGWEVKGIEPDNGAAQKAKELTGVDVDHPSQLHSVAPSSLDVVTMWHVLEHVHDLQGTLKTVKLLLKPDGTMFVAVPNYESLDAHYYKHYWAAYDVPRHLYHFSAKSMQQLMEMNGFKIVTKLPMWFDSFYVSLLSEKYKKNPLSPLFAFCVGLLSNLTAFFNGKSSSLIYVIKHI